MKPKDKNDGWLKERFENPEDFEVFENERDKREARRHWKKARRKYHRRSDKEEARKFFEEN